ncbi:MAG: aldehyde dehydrogenase family protein, partial [Planctomycetota bacterium]
DTLLLAGVHLHACVRATAIDAYRRGLRVWIARDAVASYDALHAEQTRRYLADRVARFLPAKQLLEELAGKPESPPQAPDTPVLPTAVIAGERHSGDERAPSDLLHVSPRRRAERLWRVPVAGAEAVADAAAAARRAGVAWRETHPSDRIRFLESFAERVASDRETLATQIAVEIGKPITDSRLEVDFGVGLVHAAVERANAEPRDRERGDAGNRFTVRRRPLGVVALITPWNNPLAIPMGKIAPALLYGNTVVWKPSPAGSGIALRVLELLEASDLPAGVVNLVCGDHTTSELAMAEPAVDAVSLTGSSAAGTCAQVVCAARRIPLQAELGGNNAAIVWSDCDLDLAVSEIAAGAFGSGGQRCTANRRVVADVRCYDALRSALEAAAGSIAWGDPLDEACRVGPVVSDAARLRIAGAVERARRAGAAVLAPQAEGTRARDLVAEGAYTPPTLVCCDDPDDEIVQRETFGPVLVLQRAADWDDALRLCNGVRQGLVASLFSASQKHRASFLDRAQAGILRFDASTAGASAEAPFGGWKDSGVGPPEHGDGDLEFYTRPQTVYLAPNR